MKLHLCAHAWMLTKWKHAKEMPLCLSWGQMGTLSITHSTPPPHTHTQPEERKAVTLWIAAPDTGQSLTKVRKPKITMHLSSDSHLCCARVTHGADTSGNHGRENTAQQTEHNGTATSHRDTSNSREWVTFARSPDLESGDQQENLALKDSTWLPLTSMVFWQIIKLNSHCSLSKVRRLIEPCWRMSCSEFLQFSF